MGVLGDGDLVLGVASLVLIAVPSVVFIYGVTRTARHTGQAVSADGGSLFGALGVLVTAAGVIALVWTQLAFHDLSATGSGARRWQAATGPLIVIALGLLVCIAAQMLRVMQERTEHEVGERSRGTRV